MECVNAMISVSQSTYRGRSASQSVGRVIIECRQEASY